MEVMSLRRPKLKATETRHKVKTLNTYQPKSLPLKHAKGHSSSITEYKLWHSKACFSSRSQTIKQELLLVLIHYLAILMSFSTIAFANCTCMSIGCNMCKVDGCWNLAFFQSSPTNWIIRLNLKCSPTPFCNYITNHSKDLTDLIQC